MCFLPPGLGAGARARRLRLAWCHKQRLGGAAATSGGRWPRLARLGAQKQGEGIARLGCFLARWWAVRTLRAARRSRKACCGGELCARSGAARRHKSSRWRRARAQTHSGRGARSLSAQRRLAPYLERLADRPNAVHNRVSSCPPDRSSVADHPRRRGSKQHRRSLDQAKPRARAMAAEAPESKEEAKVRAAPTARAYGPCNAAALGARAHSGGAATAC